METLQNYKQIVTFHPGN